MGDEITPGPGADFDQIDPNAEGLNHDQARNLAALAESIANSEPEQPGAAGAQPEQEYIPAENTASDEENLAGIIELLFLPAGEFGMKRTAEIWTPSTCRKVADKAVPVLRKSGVGRSFLAWCRDGFGVEELALLMVVGPLLKRTKDAVMADIADLKEAQLKAAESQPA